MTNIPLDHTQDTSGQETHRLTTLFPAPDFVKSAAESSLIGDKEKLPRQIYADQHNKLYPCHSAPATWMSALFFNDKVAEFDEKTAAVVKERIEKAAKYFGIAGLVEEIEKKAARLRDEGLEDCDDDDDWGIVWLDATGRKERHWPMRNAREVKYAAQHFTQYRDEFCFEDRHTVAEKILNKAAAYSADISDFIEPLAHAAGQGMCAAKTASAMLRDRVKLAQRRYGELAAKLNSLAELVDENPSRARTIEMRLKLAAAVDEFDRVTHLCRLYDDGGLPRPEETLFAITEKVARDFLSANIETTTGSVYALDDVEKLAVNDIRDWLGDDFADAVTAGGVMLDRDKLAAIIPTLDRGMAATFDRLMEEKQAGAACYNQAADADMLPLETLYKLAAEN
jgi:hypothetical protein